MQAVDLIEKKKRGETHSQAEIDFLVAGIMSGNVEDYQLSAWCMAVCFQGLNLEETTYLTDAYVRSGAIIDWGDVAGDVFDKHSTGGVGDKISLILIPLLAASGATMAKLSGRGLGHTGGTIDKLESIAGFKFEMTPVEFKAQVRKIKMAIASQSADLTPADGKFYALRDVTATIDSMALMAASVISKKIASGANYIVIDLKCGEGAFVKTMDEAKKLADLMVGVAKNLNRSISVVISSMDEPLGRCVGCSLEVIETLEFLKGRTEHDLEELTFELGAVLLVRAGLFADKQTAKAHFETLITNGKALESFRLLVKTQGGDERIVDDYGLMPQDNAPLSVLSDKSGYVIKIDSMKIAKACKLLGGGRERKTDAVDYAAGVCLGKKVGESVDVGEILAFLHSTMKPKSLEIAHMIKDAFVIGDVQPFNPSVILFEQG